MQTISIRRHRDAFRRNIPHDRDVARYSRITRLNFKCSLRSIVHSRWGYHVPLLSPLSHRSTFRLILPCLFLLPRFLSLLQRSFRCLRFSLSSSTRLSSVSPFIVLILPQGSGRLERGPTSRHSELPRRYSKSFRGRTHIGRRFQHRATNRAS